ncbi:MAG: hypothetical protein K2L82_17760 [Lachnospiraceae bacterium]|nr:hypothetical protein [Lachnospiraceae bacterium]
MADVKLKEKDIFESMPVRKAVLTLAVPTVISQLIVLIYNLADTWFIGQTGDPLQVAAVTVYVAEVFLVGTPAAFQIVQGLSSGVLPLIAYNYASGNRKRMDSAVRFSLVSGFVISVLMFAMAELSAPWLVRFFIEDVATIEYGAVFTRLRCISLPFINIGFMLISVFQGIGGAKQAFVLSFFRKGIFDLPLMMLANVLWTMYGLMLVEPVVELLGGSLAVFLYQRQVHTERRITT